MAKIRMGKLGRGENRSQISSLPPSAFVRLCRLTRRLMMTASSIGKHAAGGTATDRPPVPEPAFAERARTLLYLGRIGSLSTLSKKQPGSLRIVMPYGLDDRGRPIFLISTMAMHTQNLQSDPRASLLVTQPIPAAIRSKHPGSHWSAMYCHCNPRRCPPRESLCSVTRTASIGSI